MKISIIGVGHVGSLTAFILARRGLADEIVLCSRPDKEARRRAGAEALDINHAIAFTSHRMTVRAGCLEDTRDSHILIMTASVPMPSSMKNRMELAQGNVGLVRQLIPALVDLSPNSIIVNVTNPLDVITYHILKLSGFNWRQVIGTGTLIDSARFRRRLADEMDINALDINSYVIGEHGETQFATLSHAMTGGSQISKLAGTWKQARSMVLEAEAEARKVSMTIFYARGYTNYAVSMAVEMIIENIVKNLCCTLPVSVFIDGFCGERDVCLSVPCVVGKRGIRYRLEPELDAEEIRRFQESAASVREVIRKTSNSD